jgi:hypothetical protein
MALAILEYDGPAGDQHRFHAELGTNRYFSWTVGDGRGPDVVDGFRVMANRRHSSPLGGPLPAQARGRTVIDVPAEFFDRDNRHVQLLSFRERDMRGPAVSDILTVQPALGRPAAAAAMAAANGYAPVRPFDVVPFRDEAPRVSNAMFLEALAGVVQHLLPVLQPLVRSVVSPDIIRLITQLLGPGAAPAPAAPVPAAPQAPAATNGQAQVRQRSAALGLPPTVHLSQAQVAPALLAALPALLPLLQQVLTPQTIQSVLQVADPNRLLGTITNGLQQLGQMGAQIQQRELEHLEQLNPGTGNQELIQLLEGMSLSTGLAKSVTRRPGGTGPKFRTLDNVRMDFAELSPQRLGGREQVCFVAGRELAFPLAVETLRPLPVATLDLHVKEPETLKVICRRRWPVERGATGRLPVVPALSREQVAKLKCGCEYLVVATLTWKGRRGRVGTSMTQLITVVGPVTFDRLEQGTDIVPLNDVDEHREFWHKAWQGTFDERNRRVGFNLRYHYTLDPNAPRNAQMQTVTETERSGAIGRAGTLKSGLEISPTALNALLERLPDRAALEADQLEALSAPAAVERFSLAARTRFRLSGRPGDSAAVWVFPEIKLQQAVLQRAAAINAAGHVTSFEEERADVPVPALAHVIGVVSQ